MDRNDHATPWASLATKWDARAKLAAEWLRDDSAVADIGCGLMTLEPFLSSTTRYIPMDLVARDARTLVFDLNTAPIPAVDCSVAVILGVLEYLEHVEPVLTQLSRFPRSVVSYNHISVNDVLWKLRLRKKSVDWRNRHSRPGFRRLLQASGLKILRERVIRHGEALYEVAPDRVISKRPDPRG